MELNKKETRKLLKELDSKEYSPETIKFVRDSIELCQRIPKNYGNMRYMEIFQTIYHIANNYNLNEEDKSKIVDAGKNLEKILQDIKKECDLPTRPCRQKNDTNDVKLCSLATYLVCKDNEYKRIIREANKAP